MATSKSNWDQLYRELSVQNTLTKFNSIQLSDLKFSLFSSK